MNKGDAGWLTLNIRLNNKPIEQGDADDIEVTFCSSNGRVVKTLKKGEIKWVEPNNETAGCYKVFLKQEDTFKLSAGNNAWQIRILKENDDVISSRPGTFNLGESLSTEVLA